MFKRAFILASVSVAVAACGLAGPAAPLPTHIPVDQPVPIGTPIPVDLPAPIGTPELGAWTPADPLRRGGNSFRVT